MKAGSIQPNNEPAYLKSMDENSSSLRASFKQDSEALYEPQSIETPEKRYLQETVERYNLVNDFLNTIKDKSQREFASHLILQILPAVDRSDFNEIIKMLEFVSKAVKASSLSS